MRKPFLLAVILGLALIAFWLKERNASFESPKGQQASLTTDPQQRFSPKEITARTWANPASLPDHFARHGKDFGARDADEYALMAYQFLRRATAEGIPAKVDSNGTVRVFDARTGTFGAYNHNGTTKTFFKPDNPSYFNRQPGRLINLKTGQ